MNHFFRKKNLHNFTVYFLEINVFIAETIKNQFSKKNSYNQIAEFGNKLFILENWKRLSFRESFS